ncbi:MAG TPA: hypothetical protein VFG77_06365 [Nitrososphaeraceae archaeon]|nr:hypothetical protein [Nitrososphaeraceae archaeon]
MSYGKNYNNNTEVISELVENLNEVLSTENASVERIISRIDQTPLLEVKQRLKQHLDEMHLQKTDLKQLSHN